MSKAHTHCSEHAKFLKQEIKTGFETHSDEKMQDRLGTLNIKTHQAKSPQSVCIAEVNYPLGGPKGNPRIHSKAEEIISKALKEARENAPNHHIKHDPVEFETHIEHRFTIKPKK